MHMMPPLDAACNVVSTRDAKAEAPNRQMRTGVYGRLLARACSCRECTSARKKFQIVCSASVQTLHAQRSIREAGDPRSGKGNLRDR